MGCPDSVVELIHKSFVDYFTNKDLLILSGL